MKTQPKNSLKIGVMGLAAIAAILFLAACQDIFQPPNVKQVLPEGNVSISIGSGGTGNARTLFPQKPLFSSYTLQFVPKSGQQPKADEKVEADCTVSLAVGEWEITAIGFISIGEDEKEAARGRETLTVGEEENRLAIPIYGKTESGTGTLSYTVTFPEDTASLTAANLTVYSPGS